MAQRLTPRHIALIFAAGLLCQLGLLCQFQTVLSEHYAYRAQQASAKGQFPTAAAWAQLSLTLNRHQGYAAYFFGLAEARNGRATQAMQLFRRALRTMPHRAQPLSDLSTCEEKAGNLTGGLASLAEALSIEPLPPDGGTSSARLGRLLFAQNRWADGIARFRSVIPDFPQSRFPFDGLEAGYERVGAWDLAVASAFALLGSPQRSSRACERLLQLSQIAEQRPVILAGLQEIERTLRPNDPRRDAIQNVLKNIAAER